MAITTQNFFVTKYDLPSREENERVATQEPDQIPSMFWQCDQCHAAVFYLLDECPRCEVDAGI